MNLTMQELGVRAFVEQDRQVIYQAAQMDPMVFCRLLYPDAERLAAGLTVTFILAVHASIQCKLDFANVYSKRCTCLRKRTGAA